MAAPGSYTYSAQALIDAQTSFLDLVDGGTGAGKIFLYSEADLMLAEIPLNDPSGTVDGAGQLTITASGPDTSADAAGECTWGSICDGDDVEYLALPAQQGGAAVSGKLVISNTTIALGAEVTLVSCTIG